jgi:tetratricopeptide (TPR) repeat protein
MELQLDQDLEAALGDADILDFRGKLIDAQEELNRPQLSLGTVVNMSRRAWYAAASVVLLLLIAGSIYIFSPTSYSPEKLFSMYYKSGESIGIARSGNANVVEAIMKYQEKEFVLANTMFTEILNKDPGNIAIQYYTGVCSIEIKEYDKAVDLFSNIISENNNLYIEYAQWYLGLTYLIQGEVENAREIFTDISNEDGHYYKKDADSILEKINDNEKSGNFLNKMLFFVLPF